MTTPTTFSFTRYLAAKKSIDDRALNGQVRHRLMQVIPTAAGAGPLRVLEVGAGIGTMVERLVSWGLPPQTVYTAVDADPELIAESHRRLPQWLAAHGFAMTIEAPARRHFRRPGQSLIVETAALDVNRLIRQTQGQHVWDMLVAHSFLDIVDLPSTLPGLLALLRPGGLFYGTLVFDGGTILQPEIDPDLDVAVATLYHQSQEWSPVNGQASGDSRAGRHLFGLLRAAAVEIMAAGSSDWVVFAGPRGYPGDEAFFLHCIVHSIATALHGHPQLDRQCFAIWIAQRHAQIEDGSLVYIAHQLDVLGRVPGPAAIPTTQA